MVKQYVVDLAQTERTQLPDLIWKGKPSARKVTRARILLLADEGDSDEAIAAALHVGPRTIERTRQRFVEGRLESALTEKPRPRGPRKLNGKQEALGRHRRKATAMRQRSVQQVRTTTWKPKTWRLSA